MCAVGRGPRARELRGRRRAFGRPGPRGPGVRRAGRHARRGLRHERRGRRGAGRRRHRPGLRRGLAELEPRHVVPADGPRPAPRRGVAAPHAVPARHARWPRTASRARGCSSSTPATVRRPGCTAARTPSRCRPSTRCSRATTSSSDPPGRSTCAPTTTEPRRRSRRTATTLGDSAPTIEPPSVWCSWYRYFEEVTAADVLENVEAFAEHELAVDVVQIDDGWSPGLGEGLTDAERFGSLPAVVDGSGTPVGGRGIWLAPFLVGAETTLAREHPDWLVGPAGRNWGQDLVGLDLTPPRRSRPARRAPAAAGGTGDRLPQAGLPVRRCPGDGRRRSPTVRGSRWSARLSGPDVYLVGCGAPLLPSVGLVDAMRVSPDTFHEGGEDGSTGLRGLMPLAARAWQQGRLWVNDPDCVVARPSYSQRERWADAARRAGWPAVLLRPRRRARRVGSGDGA